MGTINAGDGLVIEINQPSLNEPRGRPISIFRNRKGLGQHKLWCNRGARADLGLLNIFSQQRFDLLKHTIEIFYA